MRRSFLLIFLFSIQPLTIIADQSNCMYLDEQGELRTAARIDDIPKEFLHVARCKKEVIDKQEKVAGMRIPEAIELDGNTRKVDMASPTGSGRVFLRWQRKVEDMFSKTPERAVIEALQTTARVLKTSGFHPSIQSIDVDWNIIFLDRDLSLHDVPQYLISNCHPGWMRAPADIYIIAERVVKGCGTSRSPGEAVADAELAEILLHEIGHVIEYQFHQHKFARNRLRSEGFATWFEAFAADYSRMIPKGSVRKEHEAYALRSFSLSPHKFVFNGSAYDYGRASMYFHAIVDRRRVHGLMKVYQRMLKKNLSFFEGIENVYSWSDDERERQVKKLLNIK